MDSSKYPIKCITRDMVYGWDSYYAKEHWEWALGKDFADKGLSPLELCDLGLFSTEPKPAASLWTLAHKGVLPDDAWRWLGIKWSLETMALTENGHPQEPLMGRVLQETVHCLNGHGTYEAVDAAHTALFHKINGPPCMPSRTRAVAPNEWRCGVADRLRTIASTQDPAGVAESIASYACGAASDMAREQGNIYAGPWGEAIAAKLKDIRAVLVECLRLNYDAIGVTSMAKSSLADAPIPHLLTYTSLDSMKDGGADSRQLVGVLVEDGKGRLARS